MKTFRSIKFYLAFISLLYIVIHFIIFRISKREINYKLILQILQLFTDTNRLVTNQLINVV